MPILQDGATKEAQILQGLSGYFRDQGYDVDDPNPRIKLTKLIGAVYRLVQPEIHPGMSQSDVNRLLLDKIDEIMESYH